MRKVVQVGLWWCVGFLVTSAQDECRWSGTREGPVHHNAAEFNTWSCSLCFIYIFQCKSNTTTKYNTCGIDPVYDYRKMYSTKGLYTKYPMSLNLFSNETEEFKPDALEDNSVVCDRFLEADSCGKWVNCCLSARECCQEMQNPPGDITDQCPMTWDGVDCWNRQSPNTTQTRSCPRYFVLPSLLIRNPHSRKTCLGDSSWYTTRSGKEKTDYEQCFVHPNLKDILKASVYVKFVGYSLSLLALVTASCILVSLPSLRRDEQARYRFKLHMNLFVSFLFLGVLAITLDSEYLKRLNDTNYHSQTEPCRAFTILHWYARGATYWWLFCEGLFLHRRLRNWAFADCPESLVKYYITGWVLPALPVVIWFSIHLANADSGCWDSSDDDLRFILLVPNLACLLLNLLMLLDIQRMIMTTVRAARNEPAVVVVRQGLRATLSLIPLFGLQTVLVIFRPKDLVEYDIVEALLVSTQGLFVACCYCLTKRETRHEIRRLLHQRRLIRASFSTSNATQSTRFSTNSVENNSIGMTTVPELSAKNGDKHGSVDV